MVWTATSGYAPAAVSPLSMTQSVPSRTAFATSVASARVGLRDLIIDSSICVAVTTGFPFSFRNILDVNFLGKKTRLRQLMSSPSAPSAGPSTPPSYSSRPSTPPSYSLGPLTPPNYSLGSSKNAECSNCKHLRGKISVLKATMDMHMHPEQHIVNWAALLHEVLNEMKKLDFE
nr:hypothetical protein [Tanacetum cinerariifolium]